MIRSSSMIRTLLRALALLLLLAGTAAAQSDRPSLRGNVIVDSDIVRIGDLVENAGPVANIPIFRAPDLGTSGAVSTEAVVAAIRPHQLIDIDTRGLAEVVVTHASRSISPREISDAIVQALSRQCGIGEPHNISLTFDLPVHSMQVEASASGELRVVALNYEPRGGRFSATLALPSSLILQRQPPRFTGTVVETVDAVSVNRPVDRGEVLQASDLTLLRRPKAQAGGLATMSAAVGQAARRALRPSEPIYTADLMKPDLVQRNDTVTLVYQVPGLTLTLRGKAQDAGALGDTIGVLNDQTKRIVQGVVSGPGEVTVASTMTHLAAGPMQQAASAAEPRE
jgi:flagellar basal body P-ring formation protein FlgA